MQLYLARVKKKKIKETYTRNITYTRYNICTYNFTFTTEQTFSCRLGDLITHLRITKNSHLKKKIPGAMVIAGRTYTPHRSLRLDLLYT